MPFALTVVEGTKKKNASVPAYIPANATLRFIFTNSCDFRKVPKKVIGSAQP